MARPDDGADTALLFDQYVGWLVIANRIHIHGQYEWGMHPVHELQANPGPGSGTLRNYGVLTELLTLNA